MSPALQARQADLDWFEANPGRRIHVRPVVDGEVDSAIMPPGDCLRAMVVYRFMPGQIAAWSVYLGEMPADTEEAGQDMIRELGLRMGLIQVDAIG